jgi:enoyl-CoA hydratase/carnithine racemase
MNETILIERRNGIATLTLNQPDKLNAVGSQLAEDVMAALASLNEDGDVSGIVLTGAGDRAFSAGVDLREAADLTGSAVRPFYARAFKVYKAILLVDKPVIAAVNGVAAGAGYQMALVSDLRVGHAGTRMGQPEINAGVPSVMGSYWMTLHLPLSINQDLSYTGRLMNADECERLGLLNAVVEPDALLERSIQYARDLAGKSPFAFRYTKERFRNHALHGYDETIDAAIQGIEQAYALGEPQAIMRGFLERRG